MNLMKRTLFTLLLMSVFSIGAFAEEKSLSVGDLNSREIIGQLGVALHTVHKVEFRVVDMTFTRAKADDGRLAFLIISVDGKGRDGKHYIDIPRLHGDQKPRIGMTYRFWAYETVQASGYPADAFRKFGKDAFATVGLHFRSKLIVLKKLENEEAEQGGGAKGD
jgi:hypothetical protein